ncbi:GntR family transcriptional regulator [Granulosicoccus antarcticus]|uniref:Putative D-xylose utilization operon transcriptional repressor n=1 Tax=Granulosicoccus antarcticus IMCC3135 TaxID=1192854 RepID=A0A2Z2NTS9_9GAMM|nr:GntR family transcriptional regulator [Granulosicoccus antarcticus]ASJ70524.1 putative D-xylose utilization operon transcriptional repressor [Granulosicoccus antarcticus IMCC3135]
MKHSSDSERYTSQTHRAVADLRGLIFSGELPAGTDHLEIELAERLSMSRTPVREAARVLEAQGLLEVRPRKGVRILSLSANDMDEIYVVLTELESLAAGLAARGKYTKKELRPLLGTVADMEASLKRVDREAWAEADARFHDELVRLAGNSRMAAIISNFNDQVRRARAFTLHIRPLPVKSNEEHRALYEAIARGDEKGARKMHWQHRENARKLLTSILEEVGMKHL